MYLSNFTDVVIYSNEYGMLQPTLHLATIVFNSYSMFVHIQQPSLMRRLMGSFRVHALMLIFIFQLQFFFKEL